MALLATLPVGGSLQFMTDNYEMLLSKHNREDMEHKNLTTSDTFLNIMANIADSVASVGLQVSLTLQFTFGVDPPHTFRA